MTAIDVHAHVFPKWLGYLVRGYFTSRYLQRTAHFGQLNELECAMEQNDIERCFVHPLPNRTFYRKANDYIAGLKDERLVKFGTAFEPGEIRELKERSFSGVKLHFPLQKMDWGSCSALLDEAEKQEMAVMLHLSELLAFDKYEEDRLHALRGRTNTIIIPHLSAFRELQDEKNVWFDTAMRGREEIETAARKSKRILFGSDFPLRNTGKELRKLDGMEDKERILYGNARRLVRRGH